MNTIFWRGRWITKAEFETRVSKLSAFLQAQGVGIGERVALLVQNHPIHLEAIAAAYQHGWIHAPLNYRLPPLELAPLVAYIAPKILIYAIEFIAQAREAQGLIPDLTIVTLEEIEGFSGETRNIVADEKHDTLMLLFTGGTTGTPKAAQITRAMFDTNISDTISSWGLSAKDCSVIATPMFHAGVNALATPLLAVGGRVAILEKFSPEAYLDLVKNSGCTHLFAVPTMFQRLIESVEFQNFDFSSVKYAITGGSPCPRHVRQAFAARGVAFKLGYGMTEAGVNCFTQNLEDALLNPNSVGSPMPHLKAVLRDENGLESSTGELTLSGVQICSGYWQKPLETAEVLRVINNETWLFTGDLATRDEHGYYTIIGRSKDMIISGGENIYPFEIERAIFEHPLILECAVLGVPDAQWGEVALAVVVTREYLLLKDLRTFLRAKLANYKVPKHYLLMSELPKSAAGKILKSVLQNEFITKQTPKPRELVLIHGNYASALWWKNLTVGASDPAREVRVLGQDRRASPMPIHAYTIVAPTLPGFAGTPALKNTSIASLSDWLEEKSNHLEKPVLLGHSLGGVLALELAARDPSNYAALILVSSPSLMGFPYNPAGDAIRAQLPINRVLLEQVFKFQSPALEPHAGALWEGLLDDAQALPFEIGNGLAIELGSWNRLEAASSLSSLPILILAGAADTLVSKSITEALAEQLPHAILEVCPNVGHWLPLEDPDWFAARVNAFLEGL